MKLKEEVKVPENKTNPVEFDMLFLALFDNIDKCKNINKQNILHIFLLVLTIKRYFILRISWNQNTFYLLLLW